MPQISGGGYISNKVNQAGTYYMFLVIDGQKVRKSTGTKDQNGAVEALEKWKHQVEVGVVDTKSRKRYEEIRDNYLQTGKEPQASVLNDLNKFFKNVPISAITIEKIKAFRTWRESRPETLEYKEETLAKQIAVRKLKAENGSGKKLSPERLKEIETAARVWVENGVKSTTNRRLTILRAMFNHAAEEGLIKTTDIPATFCLWANVDNIKTNKFSDEQFQALLTKMPKHLHPFLIFLYNIGMRSGQASAMTWDMIDENNHLIIPGTYTKNGEPFPLPLVDEKGKPYDWSEAIVKAKNRPNGEPIFDITGFRRSWWKACHELKLGVYNEEKDTYCGAEPHDFRRTAVSNMLAAGIGDEDAMRVSGHKTQAMLSRYGITNPRQTQNVFNMMRKAKKKSEDGGSPKP